jgi:hypothetical protein
VDRGQVVAADGFAWKKESMGEQAKFYLSVGLKTCPFNDVMLVSG